MNIPETGIAVHSPMNPLAPATVYADYSPLSFVSPEIGVANYINTLVGPEFGRAIYLPSQESLGIAVPYGKADYSPSSTISPETGRAIYS